MPASRPALARETAERWLSEHGVNGLPALVGSRGYYRDSMGVAGANDYNLYDDAIALVTPRHFVTFNANTDPSRQFPGVAVLVPGVWTYRIGTHGLSRPAQQRYTALVQAAPVAVQRHMGVRETGMFGINIHRGGHSTTSSLGCQTIYPAQWPEFMEDVRRAMSAAGRRTIHYVLVAREDRDA